MNVSNPRKRKRPINSCVECYRRKQKCDRKLPCTHCINRGVPEKCSFDFQVNVDDPASVQASKRLVTVQTDIDEASTNAVDRILLPPANLGEQTGYSGTNDSNYSILKKAFHGDQGIAAFEDHSAKQSLPDFVHFQISEIEKQLPPYRSQTRLIESYFDQCWWWFLSVEPNSFRQKFESWHMFRMSPSTIKTEHEARDFRYFSALLFQILAVALQHIHPAAIDIWKDLKLGDAKTADILSIKYSKAGMQIMDLLGRHNSTTTGVQHDMLRGNWLKNFSRGTESWYSLGNAIRQAQELRLHVKQEPPSGLDEKALNMWLWKDVLNKRIWACLFSWDAHVAFTLGRPRIINASDCSRMDLVACDVPLDTSSEPPPITSRNLRPYLVSPVIFHYSMGFLIHGMIDAGADKPSLHDYSAVQTLHDAMNTLIDSLPLFFRPINPDKSWDARQCHIPTMRLHLFSIAQTYVVALHRAHVLRRSESCEAAVTAALSILKAQADLFRITGEHKWRIYTYSFYTIDASLFLAALLLEQPRTLARNQHGTISEALWQSLDRLQKMQNVSAMAKTGTQLLRKCMDRIEKQYSQAIQPDAQGHGTAPNVTEQINKANTSPPEQFSQDTVSYEDAASFKAWIEQMDSVMLPILEAGPDGHFDSSLWDLLLDG